ncbi:unnamed protein product [Protopolystoma xenopodis]|uniref:Uncharacterized protein n=1 Tax=Protopolystoma xenopodis TaxID=117903 RepID=A0A3S5B3C7_9PLAT|nr:unnamed protein product [Protopolystoma xenopodis]
MLDFLASPMAHGANSQLAEELAAKGVKVLNFYDVVFDLILLDALEVLANPPSSILSVTRNQWLSASFKRTAIDSAIWTILMGKRKMLQRPDGFYAHYYALVGTFAPALAWGFLGPDAGANRICSRFREALIGLVRQFFVAASPVVSSASGDFGLKYTDFFDSIEKTSSSLFMAIICFTKVYK